MLGPVLSYSTLFYMVRARPDVKPFFLHIIFDQTDTPFVNLPLKIVAPLIYMYLLTVSLLFLMCTF